MLLFSVSVHAILLHKRYDLRGAHNPYVDNFYCCWCCWFKIKFSRPIEMHTHKTLKARPHVFATDRYIEFCAEYLEFFVIFFFFSFETETTIAKHIMGSQKLSGETVRCLNVILWRNKKIRSYDMIKDNSKDAAVPLPPPRGPPCRLPP